MANGQQRGGIGFLGALTLLFIGLKLTNYIDWSWWWILSPIWGVFAFAIIIVTIIEVLKNVAK